MKVLVADDHPLVLAGLRQVVAQLDPAAETLTARSFREVLEQISVHHDLELILLDFRMPGMDGVASVRQVVDRAPAVPVVVVSAHGGESFADDLAQAGVAGLIPKSVGEPAIAEALHQVLAGGRSFPTARVAGATDAAGPEPASKMAAALRRLTRREGEVLDQLVTGLSNKEIARRLGCSDATVKVHVKAILKKLGAPSRTVVIAMLHTRG